MNIHQRWLSYYGQNFYILQEIKYCGYSLEASPNIFMAFDFLKKHIKISNTKVCYNNYNPLIIWATSILTICILMDFPIHIETIEYGTDHCVL